MPGAPRVCLAALYSQWINHDTGSVEPNLLGADLPEEQSSVPNWPLCGNSVATRAGCHRAYEHSCRAEAA